MTSIGEWTFWICSALTSVMIPNSVTSIGGWAFSNCDELAEIHYDGTIEEWKNIKKGSFWNSYTGNFTVYCTDGNLTKEQA